MVKHLIDPELELNIFIATNDETSDILFCINQNTKHIDMTVDCRIKAITHYLK